MEFTRESLEGMGFVGFVKISFLKSGGCKEIPKQKGVYIILSERRYIPEFLKESIGGHFKGRNPTVSITELEENWVDAAPVIYIGKAGGKSSNSTLPRRIKQYMEYGKGKPVGHQGGRYIWQVKDIDNFLVAWKPLYDEDPDNLETELIAQFKLIYGKRPFANLNK